MHAHDTIRLNYFIGVTAFGLTLFLLLPVYQSCMILCQSILKVSILGESNFVSKPNEFNEFLIYEIEFSFLAQKPLHHCECNARYCIIQCVWSMKLHIRCDTHTNPRCYLQRTPFLVCCCCCCVKVWPTWNYSFYSTEYSGKGSLLTQRSKDDE